VRRKRTCESKFDKAQATLQEHQAEQVKKPPEVKQVSFDQQNVKQN